MAQPLDGWHYQDGDESKGPFAVDDLRALFAQQVISSDTRVWNQIEGEEWKDLSSVPSLYRAVAPTPAAPGGAAAQRSLSPMPRGGGCSDAHAAQGRRPSLPRPDPGPDEGWVEKHALDGTPYYFNTVSEALSWDKPASLRTEEERQETLVWVRDTGQGWAPAQLLEDDGSQVTVKLPKGKRTLCRGAEEPLWTFARSELQDCPDDVVMLHSINEAQIAHALRKRFEQGRIYTWVGASATVLISINPYRMLPLYSLDTMEEHRKPPPNRALAPHVFAIAQGAYSSLRFNARNQSILISGESGAGKTEATKQCLSFLAEVAGSDQCLEQRVLQANPLLEAFGNAKTLRNDNSSRFGKWIETRFDSHGTISGARIESYLLEKSRVMHIAPGERSYHIFYYLFSDAAAEELSWPWPGRQQDFALLRQSGCYSVAGSDGEAEFLDALSAMQELGMSQEEVSWVLDTCAAILFLGNVQFEARGASREAGSRVADQGPLTEAAKRLCVDGSALERALTFRSIHIPGEGQTRIPLDPVAAADAVAALCKGVYGRLFHWLVRRTNESMAGEGRNFVGVLDIFGFEIFEHNSFEQLCINYCNEKLQQHFNRHTFKEEEEVYAREGIEFAHVPFVDNQPVLDLIEGRPRGLLPLLDEEIRVPKGTDASFLAKFEQRNREQPALVAERKSKSAGVLRFAVRHYAGEVAYSAEGLLSKNRDSMWSDLHDAMSDSRHSLHRALFPREGRGARRVRSVADQFSRQLNSLMHLLYDTEPRYIRCVKPNAEKEPFRFDAVASIEQMRYSGVFEAVQIRRSGYPFRLTYRQFTFRYRCLCMKPDGSFRPPRATGDRDVVEELLAGRREDFSRLQFGTTMVLYRAGEHRLLELARNLALERLVPQCQRFIRGCLAREMACRLRQCTLELDEALELGNDVDLLEQAITRTAERLGTLQLVFDHEPKSLRRAKALKSKLQVWVDVTKQLEQLQGEDPSQNYPKLAAVVRTATDILNVPHTERQQQLFEEARSRLSTCAATHIDPKAREALHTLERGGLEAVLAEADSAAYESEEVSEIRRLLALPEADFVKQQLRRAVALEDPVRRMDREIKLMEIHVAANAWMFAPERYPQLRHPAEFANAKILTINRAAIAAGMFEFSTKPIPTSLTVLSGPQSKAACRMFRSIQGYMGERRLPFPAEVARELCGKGFSEESIRGEMYCQLVKQLRGNGRKGSVQRGWELMALFLQTFPPPADLTPFLHAFLRDSAPGNHSRRFVDQLHRISYEGRRKKPPSAETMEWMLRSLFHGPRRHSRFSSSGQPARPRGGETEGAAQGAGAAAESGASRRYRALYDFAVTDGAMLTFRANQVLTVTDQSSADWWVAELDEDEGYVPCNFLQPLE